MKLKMKKNKTDFDFKLSSIKKSFDIEEFNSRLCEPYNGRFAELILDSSIYLKEANTIYGGEGYMEIDQVNELLENIYVDFYDNSKNKVIRNEIFNDMFNGTLLPKISDNFKLELFFQNKNESHYLIYSDHNKQRIYIACTKDLKKSETNAYIVSISKKKISKTDFLNNFINDNGIKDNEGNYIFIYDEDFFSEETSLNRKDFYLYTVKSFLPKIGLRNKTKDEILEIILKDVSILIDLPSKLRKDKEFILNVIKSCKYSHLPLYYLDDDLKKDKDIVFEAIKEYETPFQFAHEKLKKDREFVLKVVKQNGLALKYTAPLLQKDEEVVLFAIEDFETLEYSTASAILYADKNLQRNKKFILKAIEKNPEVFEHISNNFKKDSEILKELESTKFWNEYVRIQSFKEDL